MTKCSKITVLTRNRDLLALPPDRRRFVQLRAKDVPVEKAGARSGVCPRTAWNWEAWRKAWLGSRGAL